MKYLLVLLFALSFNSKIKAQTVDPDALGGWYMFFWDAAIPNKKPKTNFGFQGDVQYRNWNIMGDLEQLLLRGGLTYTPNETKLKLTLGYGFVMTGAYGMSYNQTSLEHRIYQEASYPHKIGTRIHLNHRLRFEQRFVDNQNFRMRVRYNLFVNIPLNNVEMKKGTFYIALYNEIFVNTAKDIGNGKMVDIFDRNRLYGGIGYHILDKLKIQLAYMYQSNSVYGKGQLQLSVHTSF